VSARLDKGCARWASDCAAATAQAGESQNSPTTVSGRHEHGEDPPAGAIHMKLRENTNHGTGADSCTGWIRV